MIELMNIYGIKCIYVIYKEKKKKIQNKFKDLI